MSMKKKFAVMTILLVTNLVMSSFGPFSATASATVLHGTGVPLQSGSTLTLSGAGAGGRLSVMHTNLGQHLGNYRLAPSTAQVANFRRSVLRSRGLSTNQVEAVMANKDALSMALSGIRTERIAATTVKKCGSKIAYVHGWGDITQQTTISLQTKAKFCIVNKGGTPRVQLTELPAPRSRVFAIGSLEGYTYKGYEVLEKTELDKDNISVRTDGSFRYRIMGTYDAVFMTWNVAHCEAFLEIIVKSNGTATASNRGSHC